MKQTLKNEEKRRSIIEASIECINEGGISNLTVRNVAGKVGCAVGLINRYFKSMDILIENVFLGFGDDLYIEVKDISNNHGGTSREKLKKIVHANFRGTGSGDSLQMWIAFWSLRSEKKALQALHEKHYKIMLKSVTKLFKDINPKTAQVNAVSFIAILNGLWFERALGNQSLSYKNTIKICIEWVDSAV